jgi:serine/threonine protein kinase
LNLLHCQLQNEVGACHCSGESIEIFGDCLSQGVFAAIVSSIGIVLAAQILWWYAGYRRRKSDSLWQVNTEELHFGHPVEVIGQGAFGVVLLAEYRGTKVAIKRVLPVTNKKRSGSIASLGKDESLQLEEEDAKQDIEGGMGHDSMNMTSGDSKSSTNQLNFLGRMSFGGEQQTRLQRWLPFLRKEGSAKLNSTVLGTVSGSSTNRTFFATIFPWCDETARRQEEFKEEMRLLSRLRHPCKYQSYCFCISEENLFFV